MTDPTPEERAELEKCLGMRILFYPIPKELGSLLQRHDDILALIRERDALKEVVSGYRQLSIEALDPFAVLSDGKVTT